MRVRIKYQPEYVSMRYVVQRKRNWWSLYWEDLSTFHQDEEQKAIELARVVSQGKEYCYYGKDFT